MKQLGDIICIDHCLTEQQLSVCEEASKNLESKEFTFPYGTFPNQLIASVKLLQPVSEVVNLFSELFSSLFECEKKEFDISELVEQTLYLPWDIHTDLFLNQIKPGFRCGYNFLVPLHDVQSRTIMFNQCSDITNNFHEYKESHEKLKVPIDLDFWNENLSFCWPQDREYLSLKQALPYQRRGQLLGFKRNYFHSSDNFHTRGITKKSFIQVRLDFAI